MKVLMLSTDRKVLEPGSKAGARLAGYGSFCESLTIMVVGKGERQEAVLAPNVLAVAPGGRSKFEALTNAIDEGVRLGRVSRVDIVSAQDPFFIGLAGLRIAKRLGVPLQVQIHTDFMNPAYVCESPKHIIESLIARWVLPRAQCVRAVSARVAKSALKLTHAPVATLPVRVTPHAPVPARPDKSTMFITISRLTPEKRIHLAIDAVAQVPGVELSVIGEGKLRTSLEARARNCGVAERVHFLGWVDDLAPYRARAAAFIQMSAYEGYGMALMEAALAGCPIITTDVGTVGDQLPCEDVRIVTNAGSLARAMADTIQDPRIPHPPSIMTETEYHAAYADSFRTCLP